MEKCDTCIFFARPIQWCVEKDIRTSMAVRACDKYNNVYPDGTKRRGGTDDK